MLLGFDWLTNSATQYAIYLQHSRVLTLWVDVDCSFLTEKNIICILQEDFRCLCGVRQKGSNMSRGRRCLSGVKSKGSIGIYNVYKGLKGSKDVKGIFQ